MLWQLLLAMLVAGAAADPGPANPPYGSCLCLTGNSVRVRSGAGLRYRTIGYASKGECYRYLGQRSTRDRYTWYKLRYKSTTGWTAGTFLDRGSSAQCTAGGSGCLCLTGNNVRVRSGAGLRYRTIGYASRGECYNDLGQRISRDGYTWYKLNYKGTAGWTAGAFLGSGTTQQCSAGNSGSASNNCRLSHSAAVSRLSNAGIDIRSSGGCSNRNIGTCTSLDTIRCKAINDIIWFKGISRCQVTVTGGTETGHSTMTYSHWNGYKLDISLSTCVDDYIESRFSYKGIRGGDRAPLYRDSKGNTYAKEGNHWDILYP